MRRMLPRLWPHKVRLRLTLLYAGLFLVAGGALLGLTYGLVAAGLPTSNPAATSSPHYRAQLARINDVCKATFRGPGKPPPPVRAVETECKQASEYVAGVQAGAQTQRNRELHILLLYCCSASG